MESALCAMAFLILLLLLLLLKRGRIGIEQEQD
jgi:hypothetical protein